MLITHISAISLHYVRIFFINDRSFYHIHQKARDPGCIKFIIPETMSEIQTEKPLKLVKFPRNRLFHFPQVWEELKIISFANFWGWNVPEWYELRTRRGKYHRFPLISRLMGSQPFIGHVCWKKHMKYDSLLRT